MGVHRGRQREGSCDDYIKRSNIVGKVLVSSPGFISLVTSVRFRSPPPKFNGRGEGMIKIWDIKLYQKKKGKFRVVILAEDGKRTEGVGWTPHEAYNNAEIKMVIKPWLKSEG